MNPMIEDNDGNRLDLLDADGDGNVKVEGLKWLGPDEYRPVWESLPPGTRYRHFRQSSEFAISNDKNHKHAAREKRVPSTNGNYTYLFSNGQILEVGTPLDEQVVVMIDGVVYEGERIHARRVYVDGEFKIADEFIGDLSANEHDIEVGDRVRVVLGGKDGKSVFQSLNSRHPLCSGGAEVGKVYEVGFIEPDGDLTFIDGECASPATVERIKEAKFSVGDYVLVSEASYHHFVNGSVGKITEAQVNGRPNAYTVEAMREPDITNDLKDQWVREADLRKLPDFHEYIECTNILDPKTNLTVGKEYPIVVPTDARGRVFVVNDENMVSSYSAKWFDPSKKQENPATEGGGIKVVVEAKPSDELVELVERIEALVSSPEYIE